MKSLSFCLAYYVCLMCLFVCCSEEEPMYTMSAPPAEGPTIFDSLPEGHPHRDAALKILAIGNSFTMNSTNYIPWLLHSLTDDNVCMAQLIKGGASLYTHWKAHKDDQPIYTFQYTYQGKWHSTDIQTIDCALASLDWDIIVFQQVSHLAGDWSSYQPYLNRLMTLFRWAHPEAELAWHYTWAYHPFGNDTDFKRYNNDAEVMYGAIMEAANRASAEMELRIPSATLIKRLREEFTEVEDGFSSDGRHITDPRANYALSILWYETLIASCGFPSALTPPSIPSFLSDPDADRILPIISSTINY